MSLLAPLTVTGRNPAVFVADFNRDGAPDILTDSRAFAHAMTGGPLILGVSVIGSSLRRGAT